MEKIKAKKIVQDMVLFHFYSEGISDTIDSGVISRLQKYSLQTLLTASKIVEENNGETYVDEDGIKKNKRQFNIADRLIAAIYCLLNYDSVSSKDCSPIINDRRKGLYIVH